MIVSKTPLRLSLGGGGTDLPSWYKKNGSFLISMTINKYIYVISSLREYDKKIWLSYSKNEVVNKVNQIKNKYLKECLKFYNLEKGLEIHTISDIPGNSGLGSSGAFLVGVNAALDKLFSKKINLKNIAERSCMIESEKLKRNTGKQDQFSSTFGGLNKIEVNKSGKVSIQKIPIKKDILKKLNSNILLYFSGEYRDANKILTSQKNNINHKKSTRDIMSEIQEIGYLSYNSLLEGDLNQFGQLLDRHYNLKRKISSNMSSKKLNQIYDYAISNGSIGGKNIGAGGGGLFMFYVAKNKQTEFREAMMSKKLIELRWSYESKGVRLIDFRF